MPGTADNMHRFNVTALAVFERLYASFPNPIDINAGHLGIEAASSELPATEIEAYGFGADHVVSWLAEEGFLRFSNHDFQGVFYEARLTLKGLTILGHVPRSLTSKSPKVPLIDRIKKALVGGAEKAGVEATKALVGEIFKLSLQVGSAASTGGMSA